MWSPVEAPLAFPVSSGPVAKSVRQSAPEPDKSPCAWTEQELLERLLASDALAWRELTSRYSRLITSCIQRVLGRFSRKVSTDSVEEIYATFSLKLLANDKHQLRSFEPSRGNKLGTWLGMLATHCTYDYLRSVRREPSSVSLTEAEVLSSELRDPCENAVMNERAELVRSLLADFSERDREFVALYFGDGLSPERVAELLGISVKTVYSKKHKIQRRLAEIIGLPALVA